jgi:hypothetical protein
MCAVVGQLDAFPYSNPGDDYYVYADPDTQRLQFLPWGMDESFYAPDVDVKRVYSILATTCMQVPSCFDAFVARTWEAMDAVDSMDLLGRMAAIRSEIAPYVSMDTRKPYTDAKVTTYQNSMQSFVAGRRSQLEEYLPPPE